MRDTYTVGALRRRAHNNVSVDLLSLYHEKMNEHENSHQREVLQTRPCHNRIRQHSDVKCQHYKEIDRRVLDQGLHEMR